MNKSREFLDGDDRFEWAVHLSDRWLERANKIDIQNKDDMNRYAYLFDMSDELLYCAMREKASFDGLLQESFVTNALNTFTNSP